MSNDRDIYQRILYTAKTAEKSSPQLLSSTTAIAKQEIYNQLISQAKEVAQKAYAPYSKYHVGSALLTTDGKIFLGCNVENVNFAGTICAERTAIVKAVSEGYRNFQAIALVCFKNKECWPCGVCRQSIFEFGPDIDVIVEGENNSIEVLKIKDLLPPKPMSPSALLGE